MRFVIDAEEIVGGWRVRVDHGDDMPTEVMCPHARTAFQVAGTVMHAVCVEDPLERSLRGLSAVDGPREGGGV
jgi:hypothetical protein